MGLFDLTPDQNDQLLGMAMGLLSQSGPSTAPRSMGQAFGAGLQGMKEARQAALQKQMLGLQAQHYGLQNQKLGSELQQINDWRTMFGMPPTGATTPPAPNAQAMASPQFGMPGLPPPAGGSVYGSNPMADVAQMTDNPARAAAMPPMPAGFKPDISQMGDGPTIIPTAAPPAGAGLPSGVRQMIGALGPEKGGALLAQYQLKNMERGQYVPDTQDINGIKVPGQRDRFSGKFEPFSQEYTQNYKPETRSINGVDVPGQVDRAGKWTPLDPATTRLSVNNTIMPEQAGATQAAKDLAEVGKNYYESSQQARKDLGKLQMSRRILESGVETGMGTETKMGIANFAKSMLGVELDPKLPDKEMLQGLGQAMAIDSAPKGQGQVSNYEREIFQKAVATNMGRSTEGNKKLMDYYIRLKQRDAQIGQMYEQELEKNGRITPQFLAKVREHYEKPTFSDEEMKGLVGMAGGQPQTASRPPLSSFQR